MTLNFLNRTSVPASRFGILTERNKIEKTFSSPEHQDGAKALLTHPRIQAISNMVAMDFLRDGDQVDFKLSASEPGRTLATSSNHGAGTETSAVAWDGMQYIYHPRFPLADLLSQEGREAIVQTIEDTSEGLLKRLERRKKLDEEEYAGFKLSRDP